MNDANQKAPITQIGVSIVNLIMYTHTSKQRSINRIRIQIFLYTYKKSYEICSISYN